jgi:hypothetical protein
MGNLFLVSVPEHHTPKSIVLVHPGVGVVVVHSHDLMAKKNPVIAISVTTAVGES